MPFKASRDRTLFRGNTFAEWGDTLIAPVKATGLLSQMVLLRPNRPLPSGEVPTGELTSNSLQSNFIPLECYVRGTSFGPRFHGIVNLRRFLV